MGTNLNKYFAGELTSEEKEVFLLNVKQKLSEFMSRIENSENKKA